MKLYFYEWKKLFLKKNYLIIFIGLLILNIGVIGYGYKVNYHDKQLAAAEKYYSLMFAGDITQQKVQQLKTLITDVSQKKDIQYYSGGQEGDILVLQDIYDDMYNKFQYQENIKDYLEILSDNISYFEKNGNYEKESYNLKLYNEYSDRTIKTYDYIVPWEELLSYQNTNTFIMLSLILGLIIILLVERETKVEPLLYTTQFGRKHLKKIKYLHIISIPIFTVFIFSIVELMTFLILYGFSGFLEPIYALKEFVWSPIDCSIFAFYGLIVVMRIILFAFISLLIYVLFQCLKRKAMLISMISIICIIVVLSIFSWGQILNPLGLFESVNLFLKGQCISIFNYSFFTYQWSIILTIIYFIVLTFISLKGQKWYSI